MPKRDICIYIDDGVSDVGRQLRRAAQVIENPHLTQDGTGKQRKSLYHVQFNNEDGSKTIVKSFFRVTRAGSEEYVIEVLNSENSEEFLECKRKADEIMAKYRTEDKR